MIFVIVVSVEGRAAWGDHMLQPPLPAGSFPLANSPLLLHDTSSAPSVRTSVRGGQLVWWKFSCENDCLHELLFLTNYWHLLWSHWASHAVTAGTVQWNAGFMSHEQTPCLIMHHLFWLFTSCAFCNAVVHNAVVLGRVEKSFRVCAARQRGRSGRLWNHPLKEQILQLNYLFAELLVLYL